MIHKEIDLVGHIIKFIQNPRKKENLRFQLLLPIFLYLVISSGAAASSSWEFTPENPVVGDVMEIRGTGFEGKSAEVLVTFEEEVHVVDGKYEYLLEDVKIPSGFDNSFTVKATGVDDLSVRAKMLLWITKTAEAKDGIATVSQKGIPEGMYKIRIDGKASGPNVKLKIIAKQEVEVNSKGSFSYTYNTSSIPAGGFEVEVGGITKKIDLQPGEDLPLEMTPSSEQNSTEERDAETIKETSSKITEETTGQDKKFVGISADLKYHKVGIATVLAGLILFAVCIKRMKP